MFPLDRHAHNKRRLERGQLSSPTQLMGMSDAAVLLEDSMAVL